MCGIAGIASSSEQDLGTHLGRMLATMQRRGPDGAGYVIGEAVDRQDTLEALRLENKRGRVALGHVRLAITGAAEGLQPFQSDDGRLSLLHNGEIYNYRELWSRFRDPGSVRTGSDSEVLMRRLEQEYEGDLHAAVDKIIGELDGVYALAITDRKEVVIARDRIGVRQLYYLLDGDRLLFASEKKALQAVCGRGDDIQRLLPAHTLTLGPSGHRMRRFWDPRNVTGKRLCDADAAIRAYDAALRRAVGKRVANRDRVGIIFSGGIDSFLIAYLVKQLGVPFTCYTAGCGDEAPDIRWARRLAERHGFPLQIARLDRRSIERMIPEVIRDIEDHSLNQVEVAIPIHASVGMAQRNDERVILSGQGADELFGGYPWYPAVAAREGYDAFERRSREDAFLLYRECLEREDKIAMSHSIELRVPFLDPEVIGVAFSITPELKIRVPEDRQGKRIHREYCRHIGIEDEVAMRIKEAAQHGANVHNTMDDIARLRVPEERVLEAAGYDPDRSVTEKLGSSSRYGFRYGDAHLWKPAAAVQFYLDDIAAGLGLLPEAAGRHYLAVNRALQAAAG